MAFANETYSRLRLTPAPGQVKEYLTRRAYCLELEAGGQAGVRLALANPDGEAWPNHGSISFEKDGSSVPSAGTDRFWISWPPTASASKLLELNAWHLPGAHYTRDRGGLVPPSERYVLLAEARDVVVGVGVSQLIIPAGNFEPYSSYDVVPPFGSGVPVELLAGAELWGFIYGLTSQTWEAQIQAHVGGGGSTTIWSIPSVSFATLGERGAPIWGFPVPLGRWRVRVRNTDTVRSLTIHYQIGIKVSA